MDTFRRKRVLIKVAGLPRYLANIAKKVTAANPREKWVADAFRLYRQGYRYK